MNIRTKFSADDIAGWPSDWLDKYGDEFAEELAKAFIVAFAIEAPAMSIGMVRQEAAEWARVRGTEKIKEMEQHTREGVRRIVAKSISEGEGLGTTTRTLRDDFLFSPKRASMIARTETAIALGQGQKKAAVSQNRDEKHWVTSGDIEPPDPCLNYESMGWIPIGESFDGMELDTVPAHPNCRCVVRYRTKEIHDSVAQPEFRCTGCHRLLARNVSTGTRIHCRHCKQERVA